MMERGTPTAPALTRADRFSIMNAGGSKRASPYAPPRSPARSRRDPGMSRQRWFVRFSATLFRLTLVLSLGFGAAAVWAQGVSMTAEPCLGGFYKSRAWL